MGDDDENMLREAIYLVMLGKAGDSIASLLFFYSRRIFLVAKQVTKSGCYTYRNLSLNGLRCKLQVKLPRITALL